ncbi:porin [Aquabacterium sp. OR-4]|uniref:porin n=1 Tax=Aquabacterium sp. OR-4 TaxID=2978127 RepID=UPI0028C9CBB4|nr:porin [Aquabacterium sp. OR-4]MDT7838980.1 porin [Aquabacterium sp. OR-4]
MTPFCQTLGAAGLALCATAATAQNASVTIYGSMDQYFNYMRSSSGTTLKGTEEGASMRSRLGFRVSEDLGDGLTARVVLEGGLNSKTGTSADSTRFFDRQAFVALASPKWGEFRLGRQNGSIFFRGDYIDYSSRTLGSMINNFGVPSRYNNDIAYISPRMQGLQIDAHVALAETPAGLFDQAVFQGGFDYVTGPYRVGYAGLRAKPADGAAQGAQVFYDNLYANYDHGKGKVYLAYVRSNNSTSTAVSANAGSILGNVGGLVAGTNADVNRSFDIWQVSADYQVSPLLRVGALWGWIKDNSGGGQDASGGSLGAYYSLSKRTTVFAMVDTLRNGRNAGFRPSGSAGLSRNFTQAADINGRSITGVHSGLLVRF